MEPVDSSSIVLLDFVISQREDFEARVEVTLGSIHLAVFSEELHEGLSLFTLHVISIEGDGLHLLPLIQEYGRDHGGSQGNGPCHHKLHAFSVLSTPSLQRELCTGLHHFGFIL